MRLRNLLQLSERRLNRLAKTADIEISRLRAIAEAESATGAELVRIARVLGVSASDLTRGEPTAQRAEFRFRAAAAHSSTSIGVGAAAISEVAARIDGISEMVGLGRQVHCSWVAPPEIRGDAFALAGWFRESCFGGDQVSPMLELPTILDSCLGVVLVVLKRAEIDGVCAVVDGTPYIFVRAQFKPRMLFTLAHELGHLLAHATEDDFATLDPLGSVSRRPRWTNEEGFANRFASELLLPRSGVGLTLKGIRKAYQIGNIPIGDIEIMLLAHIFGVSFEAAAIRCESLDLIPSGGARSLVEFVSREFGSPEKRASAIGLPERPSLEFPQVSSNVLRAASRAISEGEISIGRVLDRLHIDVGTLFASNRAVANESYH